MIISLHANKLGLSNRGSEILQKNDSDSSLKSTTDKFLPATFTSFCNKHFLAYLNSSKNFHYLLDH